ncbi:uncharacterized protein PAN0_011d4243 [Moesziomyces antarcticus]|uniref:Uncharacterized protein n=1 Tax=Pseudozyma antarctica TaxID=84753 RepID=A0A081CH75_PSEA2|nr:uncharacterized protein PAN0_011d4243 [Moesziomyces antarcticus]GAK66021.1 hypothetical protein PAN0_011d4243 [Moesziomyces antarcticus]
MAHFPMFLFLLLDCNSASLRLASLDCTVGSAAPSPPPDLPGRVSQLERLLGRLALTRIFDSPSGARFLPSAARRRPCLRVVVLPAAGLPSTVASSSIASPPSRDPRSPLPSCPAPSYTNVTITFFFFSLPNPHALQLLPTPSPSSAQEDSTIKTETKWQTALLLDYLHLRPTSSGDSNRHTLSQAH